MDQGCVAAHGLGHEGAGRPADAETPGQVTISELRHEWYIDDVPKKCRGIYESFGSVPPESGIHGIK